MRSIDVGLVAFYTKDVILPFIVVDVTVLALIAAYRRGLFTRTRLPPEEPRTIIVHGDVMGGISTPSNLREIALDASKVDEYHRQSIAQSRISFWFSLIFASLGFLIIATSVFTYTDKTTSGWSPARSLTRSQPSSSISQIAPAR